MNRIINKEWLKWEVRVNIDDKDIKKEELILIIIFCYVFDILFDILFDIQ